MTIYLYIKTHNDTGLKYFGKTTKKDPHKYTGSGKYWKRHLKKHGSNYSTEIVATFEDESSCQEFALNFSKKHNIVDSDEWANLQEENGLDGAPKGHKGHKFTPDQLENLSQIIKQRWEDPEYKERLSQKQSASWTQQRKEEQAKRLTGKKRPEHSEKMKQLMSSDHYKRMASKHFSELERTDTHRENISIALKGKPKTTEHIQKIKEVLSKRTPEEWEKILETRRSKSKPKFEIDGVSYVSLKQASEQLGISPFLVKKLITRHF